MPTRKGRREAGAGSALEAERFQSEAWKIKDAKSRFLEQDETILPGRATRVKIEMRNTRCALNKMTQA